MPGVSTVSFRLKNTSAEKSSSMYVHIGNVFWMCDSVPLCVFVVDPLCCDFLYESFCPFFCRLQSDRADSQSCAQHIHIIYIFYYIDIL